MNLKGLLGGRMGVVVVEHEGFLPDEVFETISHHGGRIEGFAPLTIASGRAAELGAALAGVLARSEVPVRMIRLRRSRDEVASHPVAVG